MTAKKRIQPRTNADNAAPEKQTAERSVHQEKQRDASAKGERDWVFSLMQLLLNLCLGGTGFWRLSLPPQLATQTRIWSIIGMVASLAWMYPYRKKLDQLRSEEFPRPLLLTLLAAFGFGAARFGSHISDEFPPSRAYADWVDFAIVLLYACAFSVLSVACFLLIARAGKDGKSLLKSVELALHRNSGGER